MKQKITTLLSRPWFFLLALFAVCLVTYGFALTRMGLYWDDWQAIFIGREKIFSFWTYFSYDRPVSAWTYVLTYPLLGSSLVRWQLFTILLRWLTAAGMWWALIGLWPQHRQEVSWMALLWAVYPGFTQQPVSVAYSQHFICYALYTLSLGLMVWSVRKPRLYVPFTILAALGALLGMLTMEYFVGLEILRPVMLWFMLRKEGEPFWQGARRALLRWLPYALALGLFFAWRFLFFARFSSNPEANAPLLLLNAGTSPLQQIVHLVEIMLQDFVHLNLFAWVNTILPETIDFSAAFTLATWAVGAVLAVGIGWYLVRFSPKNTPGDTISDGFIGQGVLLGLLGVVAGGLPVWSTDRQAIVGLWSDRFALAPMFGAAILLVALLYWLARSPSRQAVVLGLLLALAIGAQMRNVNDYRKNWLAQRDFYWQMYWRMPGLKPGTLLLGTKLPFSYTSDYALGFATNLIYAPTLKDPQVPYWFLSALRYKGGAIPDFQEGLPVQYDLRSLLKYDGSTSQAVVLYPKSVYSQCMILLRPEDRQMPKLTGEESALVEISHPGQVLRQPARDAPPPAQVFGREPARTWCYFYEKAALASQYRDWEEVARLDQEAQNHGFKTKFGPELLPFIEASAYLGQWQKAGDISAQAAQRTASMEPQLCTLWQRIEKETPSSTQRDAVISNLKINLQCPKS